MKSYVTFVMTLYGGIFQDAAIQLPDIKTSMEKDLSYLRRALEQRGLAFFTLTLPDYGLWIDRSLDRGSFSDMAEIPRGIPLFRGRPRLFWGILMKVFDINGVLRPDADHWSVLLLRTLCQSLKKLETPVKPTALKKTIKEFFDVEEHLPKSHFSSWDSDTPTWEASDDHPLAGRGNKGSPGSPDLLGDTSQCGNRVPWNTLRKLSRRVTSELGSPNWWDLRSKHGPGAVSESGWESKFEFPNWPRKLGLWFPYDWFATGDLSGPPEDYPSEYEPPSRLIAVPKTQKGPRLICAEPIAHQWMQQSIWGWLRERVPKTLLGLSVSFEDQEASRSLALQASLSGSHATLDLSAASDRLSTRLVEWIFQGSDILEGMHACRTRVVKQTVHEDFPKVHVLRKFATMGSALTFPIQSLVFTVLCVWALRLAERRENDWNGRRLREDFSRVRVFGDDLIVPKHSYGLTKLVLHECGLLVNSQKSFGGVSFRESCGMDAFRGVDVTPARVHKVPYGASAMSAAALIEYTNNLYKKGMWHASNSVLGLLPRAVRNGLAVGGPDMGGLGLFSYSGHNLNTFRKRWDHDLQREYCVRVAFVTRPAHNRGQGKSSLLQFFNEEPASRSSISGTSLRLVRPMSGSTSFVSGGVSSPRAQMQSASSHHKWTIVRLDGMIANWKAGSRASQPVRMQKVRVYL